MALTEIRLDNLLPLVFNAGRHDKAVADSEVWFNDGPCFKRGVHYLVEAHSGAGKSSLCSFIYGNRTDYLGHILFDNVDIKSFDIDRWAEYRQRALAYVPQEMHLFGELTLRENIDLKNRLTNCKSDAEIVEMLRMLGIDDRQDQRAATLSVGQQQRAAIVRALCQPFDFLLLDEPVSHLDADANRAVASLIEREALKQRAAIIATSVGNPLSLESFTTIRL